MTEFNADICKSRYELCSTKNSEVERRLGNLEQTLKDSEEKQEERLTRIHERFDQISKELLRRPPPWVLAVISVLTTLLGIAGGFAIAAIK